MTANTILCATDGANGIYTPQVFVRAWGNHLRGVDPEDLEIIRRGPDDWESYTEAWDQISRDATIRFTEGMLTRQPGDDGPGTDWTIHVDQDVFLVHPDHNWEAE